MTNYKVKLISGLVRVLSEAEKKDYVSYLGRDQIRSIRKL